VPVRFRPSAPKKTQVARKMYLSFLLSSEFIVVLQLFLNNVLHFYVKYSIILHCLLVQCTLFFVYERQLTKEKKMMNVKIFSKFLNMKNKKKLKIKATKNIVTFKFCSAERDWSNHYRTEIFALAHSLHIKAIERKNLIVLNCPDKYMAKTIKMHFIR
jgi:hypothetical protein